MLETGSSPWDRERLAPPRSSRQFFASRSSRPVLRVPFFASRSSRPVLRVQFLGRATAGDVRAARHKRVGEDSLEDGHSSIYFGAAGVIWALEHLRRVGATKADFDFCPCLPQLLAMTAIAQYREAREQFGRGRYSLWTGDVGLAVYLWDCLTGEPCFPTVDTF
jgi:hypothetical protein